MNVEVIIFTRPRHRSASVVQRPGKCNMWYVEMGEEQVCWERRKWCWFMALLLTEVLKILPGSRG